MSLEQAITENTVALRELLAAIQAGAAIQTAAAPTQKAEKAKPEAKAQPEEKKPESQPTQADLGKTAAQATEALDGHANKPESAATYDDVKAAVLRLSKEKGRDVAVQVLQRCGVQKAPDLQPEQYADFVRIATEVLEGAQP